MPRVICRSPNASTLISGVKFEPHPEGGMISEEIDEAKASHFVSIPGYSLVAEPKKSDKSGDKRNGPAADTQAENKADDAASTGDAAGEGTTEAAAGDDAGKDQNPAADEAAAEKQASPAAAKKAASKSAKAN